MPINLARYDGFKIPQLTLQLLEVYSLLGATSFNKTNLFLDNSEQILKSYAQFVYGSRIFNVDKTSVFKVQKPQTGSKQVGKCVIAQQLYLLYCKCPWKHSSSCQDVAAGILAPWWVTSVLFIQDMIHCIHEV
jgi:hypothetical protein